MPQLDKVTFLSQFFWLAFFYIAFYFLLLKYFLPKMSRLLKLRQKKMSLSHDGVGSLLQENEKVRTIFDGLITKGLYTSRSIINENFQRTFDWLNKVQQNTNQTHYQNLNQKYLLSVGESSLKDNLALTQASSITAEKQFIQNLLSIIK